VDFTQVVAVLALIAALVAGIRIAVKRAARQRVEHDARLRAMAQTYLSAVKKQQAAAARTAAAPPPPTVREERECPFCAELILRKARVCKHCGREVEPLA
jgi:hypothetical protein